MATLGTQRLTDDLLAEVLRRLQATSPCSLAASRCTCKAWCTVVDTHRLLVDLPPQSLTGIFVHLKNEKLPRHIKHAASPANIVPFHYLDARATHYLTIVQHCNDLLLMLAVDGEREEAWWVLNPATRHWRIDLTNIKYQVIKPPEGFRPEYDTGHYLGKSRNGVYYALLVGLRLRIWYLDGTGDRINWILKCDVNLCDLLAVFSGDHGDRPAKAQYANCDEDDENKALVKEDFGPNFDNDNATSTQDRPKHIRYSLLGFHPNEEIVFFRTPFNRVMAYHFNSSKIKHFSWLPAKTQKISLSFPYTLCLMREFSSNEHRN